MGISAPPVGQGLGLIFFVPWGYFYVRGILNRAQSVALLLIPLLGGVQAGVGWWMVTSGFADRHDVSPYRLLIHLFLALIILLAIWEAYLRQQGIVRHPVALHWRHWQFGFLVLLIVTIGTGALVAGTRAGLIYNQYPLMGEGFMPTDYLPDASQVQSGTHFRLWRAVIFEHMPSVQFHHRILTIMTLLMSCGIAIRHCHNQAARYLMFGVAVQFLLGIATLLSVLTPLLAVMHQAGAVFLFLGGWLYYRLPT